MTCRPKANREHGALLYLHLVTRWLISSTVCILAISCPGQDLGPIPKPRYVPIFGAVFWHIMVNNTPTIQLDANAQGPCTVFNNFSLHDNIHYLSDPHLLWRAYFILYYSWAFSVKMTKTNLQCVICIHCWKFFSTIACALCGLWNIRIW